MQAGDLGSVGMRTRIYAMKVAKDRFARSVTLRRCLYLCPWLFSCPSLWLTRVMTDSQHNKCLFVCQEYRKLQVEPRMSSSPTRSPPQPWRHHVGVHPGVCPVTNNHQSWGSNQTDGHKKRTRQYFSLGYGNWGAMPRFIFSPVHTPPLQARTGVN